MSNNKVILLGTKQNKPRSVANALFFKCLAKRVKTKTSQHPSFSVYRDCITSSSLNYSTLYLFQYNETTTGETVKDKNTTIFINCFTLCYWFKVRLSLIVKVTSIPYYLLLTILVTCIVCFSIHKIRDILYLININKYTNIPTNYNFAVWPCKSHSLFNNL